MAQALRKPRPHEDGEEAFSTRMEIRLDRVIADARAALKRLQKRDGHWLYDLEADVTIPAEYIMMRHYLGDIEPNLDRKLANYIRSTQAAHGGWPLFHEGEFNISASVKAYFALKLAGDDPSLPHMRRAREAILAHGGAASSNVFTRIALALFGLVPWRAVPTMPVEIMLLPRWFPFHIDKISYWSRTVIVPLLVLMALKPCAANPRGVRIDELFAIPADQHDKYLINPTGSAWGEFFLGLDWILKRSERALFTQGRRKRAIDKAMQWTIERLNGEDGLGAIFPAMAYSVFAMKAMGYPDTDPHIVSARKAMDHFLVVDETQDLAWCQPCLSPVWDTGLAVHALLEAGESPESPAVRDALDWLVERQITDFKGDWAVQRPDLSPGGWAFQYNNAHYPDVDDTALVALALDRVDNDASYREAVKRAEDWVIGMQSKNGGWGAFDADNTHSYLNHIPFADHGALLDPPTVDVSARCVSFLAQLGHGLDSPVLARGLQYIRDEQEEDGSWFGRWGTNYIYGTWSALSALNAAGEDMGKPYIRKAVDWLIGRQNSDGGWGESGASYWHEQRDASCPSTPSQTAWALLALMAAGEVEHDAVRRGVDFLLSHPRDENGRWQEALYTAVGFPRVFYLRYHGYAAYFPLWALGRYRTLMQGNSRRPIHGL